MHRLALLLLVITSAVFCANVPQEKNKNSSKTGPSLTASKPQPLRNVKEVNSTIALPRNSTTLSQKKADRGQLITTKFDSSGNPQQQCRCIAFHLCNAADVYQSPTGERLDCDDGMVCCIEPFIYSTEAPPQFPGREMNPVTNSATTVTGQQSNDCECVAEDQCPQFGAGIIQANFKGTGVCGSSLVCCPTSETTGPTNPTNNNPTVPQCSCVSRNRCSNQPPNDTNTTPNYGQGVIILKSPLCDLNDICSSCDPTEICCLTSDVITDPWTQINTGPGETSPVPPTTPNFPCGLRRGDQNLASKITNPEDSSFGEFPWMALILRRDENNREQFVCGASLLSARVILTAGHCVNNVDRQSLIIRVGEYDTQLPSESEILPHQDRSVSEISIHPSFKASVAHYDLALVAVNEPFQLAQNVAPICAPFANTTYGNTDVFDWNRCTATGWGQNAFNPNSNANHQNTLKKIDLRIVEHEQCQNDLRTSALRSSFILDRSFICARGDTGDTCKGDGGGPLICAIRNEPNRYVQVGITSWGIGCGNEYPAAYASLYHSAEWLTSQYLIYNGFEY